MMVRPAPIVRSEAFLLTQHTGMDKMHKSTTAYIKSLSKRNEGDDREKVLPIARLGQTFANHGDDFEPDSEFGNCLIGRSNCDTSGGCIY